jgi:hypothetical protein
VHGRSDNQPSIRNLATSQGSFMGTSSRSCSDWLYLEARHNLKGQLAMLAAIRLKEQRKLDSSITQNSAAQDTGVLQEKIDRAASGMVIAKGHVARSARFSSAHFACTACSASSRSASRAHLANLREISPRQNAPER